LQKSFLKTPFGKKTQDQLSQVFHSYMQEGDFPEVVNYAPEIRQRTLQDYIDVVVYRDIVERHDIKNSALIKYMIMAMIHNVGKPFTINKFYNDTKSQGYKLGKDSLYEYMSYIEDAYLMFSVPIYAKSIRKVQTNPKKIYAIDAGLVCASTLEPDINLGRLFENIIYLDLRRKDYVVHYYLTEDRYEVDFLVQDRQGNKQLLQVTWDMNDPDTMEREVRALELAKNELKLPGKIISLESYLRDGIDL
jgi:predicted AAA+ superfamily ATPase